MTLRYSGTIQASGGFQESSSADKAVYTKDEVDALLAALRPFAIGAIYINITGVNPATELGYGTWTAFGTGRVLVGFDSGDTDFNADEKTGGAKAVASVGSNSAPTLSGSTAAESSHTHSVTSNVSVANHTFTQPTISWSAGVPTHSGTTASFTGNVQTFSTTKFTTNASGTAALTSPTSYTPAGSVTITSQGTIAWPAEVPTNSGGAVSAHSVTNNAVTSGAGSSHSHGVGTLAASAPTYTGSASSVVQPYIVVHMWKRTA